MLWRDHVGEFGLFFSMEMTKDVFGTMKPLLQINSTWLWCYNIVMSAAIYILRAADASSCWRLDWIDD